MADHRHDDPERYSGWVGGVASERDHAGETADPYGFGGGTDDAWGSATWQDEPPVAWNAAGDDPTSTHPMSSVRSYDIPAPPPAGGSGEPGYPDTEYDQGTAWPPAAGDEQGWPQAPGWDHRGTSEPDPWASGDGWGSAAPDGSWPGQPAEADGAWPEQPAETGESWSGQPAEAGESWSGSWGQSGDGWGASAESTQVWQGEESPEADRWQSGSAGEAGAWSGQPGESWSGEPAGADSWSLRPAEPGESWSEQPAEADSWSGQPAEAGESWSGSWGQSGDGWGASAESPQAWQGQEPQDTQGWGGRADERYDSAGWDTGAVADDAAAAAPTADAWDPWAAATGTTEAPEWRSGGGDQPWGADDAQPAWAAESGEASWAPASTGTEPTGWGTGTGDAEPSWGGTAPEPPAPETGGGWSEPTGDAAPAAAGWGQPTSERDSWEQPAANPDPWTASGGLPLWRDEPAADPWQDTATAAADQAAPPADTDRDWKPSWAPSSEDTAVVDLVRDAPDAGGWGAPALEPGEDPAIRPIPGPSTEIARLPSPAPDALQHQDRQKRRGTGWRRALFRGSFGLLHGAGGTTEDERVQQLAQIRAPLRGCYRVAVISLKGGVGKTTTTAGLGATLASVRGDRVVAFDANPDAGTLGDRLRRQTNSTVRDLLLNVDNIRSYSDLRGFVSQAPSHLEVLANDVDPAVSTALTAENYRSVAEVLGQYYSVLITDSGTGLLFDAMKGILGMAHTLVVVSSASVDGARTASTTLDWLSAHGYDELVSRSIAVISMVGRGVTTIDLDALSSYFASRVRAVAQVPYDPHLSTGSEVNLDELQPATRDAYIDLAALVAEGFDNY